MFIHNQKQRQEHVELVGLITTQLNNFLNVYEDPNLLVEPQSRYRLTNGGWAGEGNEAGTQAQRLATELQDKINAVIFKRKLVGDAARVSV
ncbi:MAG: hypothetical protein NTU48_08845 [Legionellales bacterium]|nr:hypothetical protein [Legionellales bacterium]